ncbi:hypothetical protein DZC31_30175 (plasmid) [Stenotrophomonas rhizophila]|nr:hypothetical protein DZC31_30175 [Stenotrophomonas rhizophila]
MALRPLPITTAYDQQYSCPTCDREQLDRHHELDEHTWTCRTCDGPVLIKLNDGAGNTALVVRNQAQKLRAAQHFVYLENDLATVHAVLLSEKCLKGGQWHLRLQGYGSRDVDPRHYFNCLYTCLLLPLTTP